MRLSRRVAGVLLLLYLLTAASIVLAPRDWLSAISLGPLRMVKEQTGAPAWISDDQVGFAANVALFMPLSFLGTRLIPRWGWPAWLMAGLVAATTVETMQMVLLSARHPSAEDVVANTLGSVMGYLLAVVVLRGRAAGDE